MIFVNSALMQQEIISLLEENNYTYVKKVGLKLYFESHNGNTEGEAKRAKEIIKQSSFGIALFFQTGVE